MTMRWRAILTELARIIIGVTFALSGFLKAIDPIGTKLKVDEFLNAFSSWGLSQLHTVSMAIAIILIATEFCIGSFLLMGIYRRLSSRLALVMMFFFTATTGYNLATGAVADCGCFGDALHLDPLETFLKNLILLPITLGLAIRPQQIKHLYSYREQWIPALLAVVGISYFIYANITTLPYIDFRPYRIGYNVRERMHREDSAYQADLAKHTRYVYERNGSKQAFTVDSLPDSTWSYVETLQPQELLDKPLKYNLLLLSPEGSDVTEEILTDTAGVFLLISPDWTKARQTNYTAINALYRTLMERGLKFYSVSPNSSDSEQLWRYQTGAEYPSLFMDATTVKTVIRSNPGLVFLKDGVIRDKLPSQYFPDDDHIATFIESRLSGAEAYHPGSLRLAPLALWTVLLAIGMLRRWLRHLRVAIYKLRKR